MGEVLAVCISDRRGIQKEPVDAIDCIRGLGIRGDAHGGDWHRQVSLLADESVDQMRRRGTCIAPGGFAENVLTSGIDLRNLRAGCRLKAGRSVVLEVTQIGKQCHQGCAIYRAAGDCVMPREGIFCTVIEDGSVRAGDRIDVISDGLAGAQ